MNQKTSLFWSAKAACLLGFVIVQNCPVSGAIVLHTFTDPHSVLSGGTIGFSYAGNKFVGSVQADGTGNVLYSTDLNGGNVQVFAPTVNIPGGSPSSEHFVASSLGLGGFPSRDIYVAAANDIIHIDNAGNKGAIPDYAPGECHPRHTVRFGGNLWQ